MDGTILIVDDDRILRHMLRDVLSRVGFAVHTAESVRDARAAIEDGTCVPDVAVVDLHMPEADGFVLLEWLAAERPYVVAMVLSGTSSIEEAVRAVQRNAFDFIIKPITDYDVFFQRIQRAVDYKRVVESRDQLLDELKDKTEELASRLEQLTLAHQTLKSHALAVQADLTRAQRIQERLLPREVPFPEKVSLSVCYRPAGKVGGDLFDVVRLDDHRMALYVADVSGHGISSAMLTVFLKDAVHGLEREREPGFLGWPDKVLRELNRRMVDDFGFCDMFISLTYAVLDVSTMELEFANAGHPPLLVRRAAGHAIEAWRIPAPALAIDPKASYASERIHLGPGDMVVLFSDGIREARDGRGIFYGEEHLCEALEHSSCPADRMAGCLEADLEDFTAGHAVADDVTVLVLGAEPQSVAFPLMGRAPSCAVGEAALPGSTEVRQSTRGGRRFVALSGACTWKESTLFRKLCEDAFAQGERSVIVDLARCRHLDSTFLGVLHELVGLFEERSGYRIELQNVPRSLLSEMSELGLTAVLNQVRARPVPLPESMTATEAGGGGDRSEMARLLIHAHEALVDADPKNADRFSQVLEVLHRQVTGDD